MNDPPSTLGPRDEFLTSRQLAAILQVSESTVRRLARSGRIPAIRLTSRITRFHLPAVRDALDAQARLTRARRNQWEARDEANAQLSFSDLF
jgi:excisionase family DNA binding protein